jgi:hypothetical protein
MVMKRYLKEHKLTIDTYRQFLVDAAVLSKNMHFYTLRIECALVVLYTHANHSAACMELVYLCYSIQYNEVGEALEPFNLKGEREEGYFDVNGNFVWRQQGEEPDAWLV